MATVLVTGMGSATGISVVKGLRRQTEIPVTVIGTDTNDARAIAGSHLCDEFFQVPPAISDKYIPTLLDICDDKSVMVLFPIVDIELEVISRAIDEFHARGIKTWVSRAETVDLCNDKHKTYRFFRQHGFPTPETWLPEDLGDVDSLQYPVVTKPLRGRGSVGVFIAETAESLRESLRKSRDVIVQEYVEGTEFTIDVLMDENSRVLSAVPRERIEVKAGVSFKGRTVRNDTLVRHATEIAISLGIQGPCNVQCMIKDGVMSFIEVNPRFSAALPLTIAAGVNGPLLLVKRALGCDLGNEKLEYRAGVYMARYFEEVFYVD